MYLGVIVNPLAQKNRAGKGDRAARLQRLVGQWGEVHETESVHALPGIVERIYSRCSHLVSDGGDGSLHWLINEMLVQESGPAPVADIRTQQRRIHRLRRPQSTNSRAGRDDSANPHRGRAGGPTTAGGPTGHPGTTR